LAIGARGNYGVERIGRNDAGADRGLVALQARWVARSVEIFMVMKHVESGLFEAAQISDDGPAVFRVPFHNFVFFSGQVIGLVEDAVRDANLANVMKQSTHFEVVRVAIGNTEVARH
jgi:hypothetical protein